MRRDGGRVCGAGWVGLIDALLVSFLLLDFQDCSPSDLLPNQKQPMEAPLQTGMVRGREFVHRTTTPGGLAVRHAMLSPRTKCIQTELRFPACIAGDLASGKTRSLPSTPGVGGGKEARIDPFCRWGHRVAS